MISPFSTRFARVCRSHRFPALLGWALAAVMAVSLGASPPAADARPKKCFGKKINRVIKGKKKKVRVKFKDVTWIAGDRITVIGKPYSHICANRGRQFVFPGKGRSMTNTGRDNDRIELHPSRI